ncbi:MAG: hypothetical protein Kow00121_60620 [Elainellaceae cyanobacterium]
MLAIAPPATASPIDSIQDAILPSWIPWQTSNAAPNKAIAMIRSAILFISQKVIPAVMSTVNKTAAYLAKSKEAVASGVGVNSD